MTKPRHYTIRLDGLYLSSLRRRRWIGDRSVARTFPTDREAYSFVIALSTDERRDEGEYVVEPYYPPMEADRESRG